MSLEANEINAEQNFRLAFERIKRGQTQVISVNSPLTQANIAKEAGCDPSAFKKSRYPSLIAEIQTYINNTTISNHDSKNQITKNKQAKRRTLIQKLHDIKIQHDYAMSLLLEADCKIVDLVKEINMLKSKLPASNITNFR